MHSEASYHTEKKRFMVSVPQHSLMCVGGMAFNDESCCAYLIWHQAPKNPSLMNRFRLIQYRLISQLISILHFPSDSKFFLPIRFLKRWDSWRSVFSTETNQARAGVCFSAEWAAAPEAFCRPSINSRQTSAIWCAAQPF